MTVYTKKKSTHYRVIHLFLTRVCKCAEHPSGWFGVRCSFLHWQDHSAKFKRGNLNRYWEQVNQLY